MRKVLWLILIALVVAAAIWYGRRVAEKSATVTVTSLLPAETLFVVHVPDFNQAREQWHQTDVYKIREEPEVRDFLQKPLSNIPKTETAAQNLADFEKLEPKDLFFAITSWTNGLKGAGGFRFKGKADDAEKFVSQLRARLLAKSPDAKTDAIEYQQHQIQTITAKGQTIATTYAGDWFFATNDVADLKTIIDRVEGRMKDRAATLASDAEFAAAFKHIPTSYMAMTYGRLDRYIEKVIPLLGNNASTAGDQSIYRKIRAFCGAFSFDGGKIRDVLFVGMPQLTNGGSLTRSSLTLGTKETFLYLASFLNLPNEMTWPSGATTGSGIPGMLQKFVNAVSSSGVTLEEWNAAFGAELGVVGDWPNGAQWPGLIATVPVKDAAKASEIFNRITTGADGVSAAQERDGARFFTPRSGGTLFSITPTIALSSKILVSGTTESAVEAAMKRSVAEASELASSENFRAAERAVPAAKHAFFYVDSALLYTRLDAALRPLLLMGAAFVPAIGQNIDLNKIPRAEIITRHLSPIVMSQDYQTDGYVTESVGPITFYEAAAGVALLGGGAAMLYQQGPAKLGSFVPPFSASPGGATPTISPSPSGTP
jgi:hypothetical protein